MRVTVYLKKKRNKENTASYKLLDTLNLNIWNVTFLFSSEVHTLRIVSSAAAAAAAAAAAVIVIIIIIIITTTTTTTTTTTIYFFRVFHIRVSW